MTRNVLMLLAAYLLGSFPTALLVSRAAGGADIRCAGDGNMGARNVKQALGWGPGLLTVGLDIGKGAAAVWLAHKMGLALQWQMAAGAAAALGHDFPIFAGFRGGQGMAAIVGALLILLPVETSWGLAAFGAAYTLSRHFEISAAIGAGTLLTLAARLGQPPTLTIYAAALFVSIGLKKWLDGPYRQRVREGLPAKED